MTPAARLRAELVWERPEDHATDTDSIPLVGTTEKTARQLDALMNLYNLGLVTPETLEQYAKPIFGEDFELVKQPEPPLLPAKAAGPADELAAQTALDTTKLKAKTKPPAAAPKKRKREDGGKGKGRDKKRARKSRD